MNHGARTSSLALLCAAAVLVLHPGDGRAQATPSIYVVKPDDSVLSIAEQLRPAKATMSQMALALVRANPKIFQSRSPDRLAAGSSLSVPTETTVLKMSASAAAQEFDRFWRAEQHFKAAVALEKSRDMFYAFSTYVYAARLGHGPAQARLGELYDNDLSGFVSRDLQESLRWYERARLNEVEIRKPSARLSPRY